MEMASEECEVRENEAAGPSNTHPHPHSPQPVFLTPTLDTSHHRKEVVAKIHEFIASESLEAPGGVTYVGQVGWEESGEVWSLTTHLMTTCRTHHLLPSERCTLLSLHDQYQAIQLCLARINKVRQGEFMAAASDVLDVWNALYRETVAVSNLSEAETDTETLEELNHLCATQESCDPMRQELQEVMKDYREFLANSLCVDHFKVFECLRKLLKEDPTLFRDVFCKVYIIEGLEQLPLMERELLKLICQGCPVYRVCAELPFSTTTVPPSPSTFNISGIHETSIIQTPSKNKQQDQTEMGDDSKHTQNAQTPSRNKQQDQTDMGDDSKHIQNTQTPIQQDKQNPQTPSQNNKLEETNMGDDSKHTQNPQTPIQNNKQQDQNNTNTNNTTTTPHTPNHTKDQTKTDTKDTVKAIIKLEREETNLVDVVNATPRYSAKVIVSSESETYIERLIFAHLRLLLNTRDELALTLACSMPGREITHQGFTDIRQEAQRKEMPMYQTIVSFILRQRLGGKGYQLEPNNPVLLHARPLGEFVDALMKLQNILEAQTDSRQGAVRILNGVKTGLEKMKGCMLKRSILASVADRLSVALTHLMEAAHGDGASAATTTKPSNLHPSLKNLILLCDVAGGQTYSGGVVDALGGDLLTQLSSSKKGPHTPLRVPSVLNLFRSPAEVQQRTGEKGVEGEKEEDLETRLKNKMGKATTTNTAQPKRYKSDYSWAPVDLSPIHVDKMNLSTSSPISGPSLMVAGKTAKRSSQAWQETVEAVTEGDNNTAPSVSQGSFSPAKSSSPATTKAPRGGNSKPKKTRSKRSLLKDISNMASNSEEKQAKKQKVAEVKKDAVKKRKDKTKPLLQGQRSITSFFRS